MCAFQTVHDPFFCTTISLTRSSTHYLPSISGAAEVPRRNHGFYKHQHSSLPAQARQAGGAVLEVVAVTGYFASAMHCVREYLVDVTLCTGPSMLPALGVEGNIGNRASLSRLLSLSFSPVQALVCAIIGSKSRCIQSFQIQPFCVYCDRRLAALSRFPRPLKASSR